MPKFQARFFNDQDESIPCRVEPIEAPDLATARRRASATMRADEVRIEMIDTDDEFRRGTPNQEEHGLEPPHPSLGARAGAALFDIDHMIGCAINLVQDKTEEALESAGAATAEVREFVKTKPYAAIGIAAAAAYVIGLHVGTGRKRVIYLKSER